MASDEKQPQSIYVSRYEKMGSLLDNDFSFRNARFLSPIAENLDQAIVPQNPHLTFDFPSQSPSPVVTFKGWYSPQKKWRQWLEITAGKYASLWVQTGILDSILCSVYEVKCNQRIILGLSQFWCQEMNTFVFPWGEATITLEDVIILSGLPVLGEDISGSLTDDLVRIVEEMNKFHVEIARKSKAKVVSHSVWLKYFMESESEYKHVAFLSLWLSRYVFPSGTVCNRVFSIAAKLSKGIKVVLAPAFLASIYYNLRKLKFKSVAGANCVTVFGPFQVVQLWAYERLEITGPNSPWVLLPGEPRVARWHKLHLDVNLPTLKLPLTSHGKFNWRPYAANVKNWRHPLYYQEMEQFVSDCSSVDEELRSFFRCLQTCKLFGLDCIETYLPQRVARQFGFDQDLPVDHSNLGFVNELAVNFFVPARSFQPGVSMAYSNWWKRLMVSGEYDLTIKDVLFWRGGELQNTEAFPSGEANGEVDPTMMSKALTKSSSERCTLSVIPELCDGTEEIVKSNESSLLASVDLVEDSREATKKSEVLSLVLEKVDESNFVLTSNSPESPRDGLQNSRSEETHASPIKVSENMTKNEFDTAVTSLRDICRVAKRQIDFIYALSDDLTQNFNSTASDVSNDNCKKGKWAGEHVDKHGIVKSKARGYFTDIPNIIELDDGYDPTKEGGEWIDTIAARRKGIKGGESFSNPIDVDGIIRTRKSRFQKFGCESGRRVPKSTLIILD